MAQHHVQLRDNSSGDSFGSGSSDSRGGGGGSPSVSQSAPAWVHFGEALFVLTSDLELEESDQPISCETDKWDSMLDAVRSQSSSFCSSSKAQCAK